MNKLSTYSRFIVTGAMALLLASCGSETYPSQSYNPGDDNIVMPTNKEYVNIDKIPIKIRGTEQTFVRLDQANSGNISTKAAAEADAAVATRGTGPIENLTKDEEGYLNTTFYGLAFKCGATDFSRTAYSPNHTSANDRQGATCLLDGYDINRGMPMKFSEYLDGSFKLLTENNDTAYYSATYTNQGYNFFVYHIDDWDPAGKTTRNQNGMYYTIDLDGKRDIIMGSAKAFTQELVNNEYSWLNDNPTMRDSCLAAAGGYSTLSGRLGVQPHVILKHNLVRMQFEGYPQEAGSSNLVITRISVVAPKQATMRVAGPTPNDYGIDYISTSAAETFLSDRDANGNYLDSDQLNGYTCVWKEEEAGLEATKRTKTIIGNADTGEYLSLLVPPQKQYRMYIYYKVKNPDAESITGEQRMTAVLSLSDDEEFQAGTIYTIRFLIWGPQRIDIGASIQGGESKGYNKGETINWDTEDWPNK